MLGSVLATEKTTRRAHKTHSIGEKVEIIGYSSYSSLPSGHSNNTYTCKCLRMIFMLGYLHSLIRKFHGGSVRISKGLLYYPRVSCLWGHSTLG